MKKGNAVDVLIAVLTNKECWDAVADIVNIALVKGCGKKDTSKTLHDIVDAGFELGGTIVEEVQELS